MAMNHLRRAVSKMLSIIKIITVVRPTTAQKATIHQVTTTLTTSKNVLFPGHNHLLTTCRTTDDPSLAGAGAINKVSSHQYQWLVDGYDLEIGHL